MNQGIKANAVGISQSVYSRIINGKAPVSAGFARKVGRYIGLDWRAVLFLTPAEIDRKVEQLIPESKNERD